MNIKKLLLFGPLLLVLIMLIGFSFIWFPSPKEPGYRYVLEWGGTGEGPGEFKEPIGIAIYKNEVFVTDSGNDRIQVFDLSGNLVREFGKPGDKSGEFWKPMHIVISGDKVYVAEFLNDRIQVLTLDGDPIQAFGRPGNSEGEFDGPGGIAVDNNGTMHVSDFNNHRIQVFNSGGEFIKQLGETGVSGVFGEKFQYPTDVTFLHDGRLVIANAYNDRIHIISKEGILLRKWGGPFAANVQGSFNGWFKVATAVAVSPNDNIFVVDFDNHRIQKFDPEGNFLSLFGKEGQGKGEFFYPTDVAVDNYGFVYIVDFRNNRIQKFEPLK